MKSLIKFFLLTAILCFTIACTQTFEDVSSSPKTKPQKGRLVMNIGSESRTTMLPIDNLIKNAVLLANSKQIKSWSGENLVTQIESDNDIWLESGTYTIELIFTDENGAILKSGKCVKKITAGDNSITINMQTNFSSDEEYFSGIGLTLRWDKSYKVDKVKAQLIDMKTGQLAIRKGADTDDEGEKCEDEKTVSVGYTDYYAFYKFGICAGQYLVKFEMYYKDKLVNTIMDIVKVAYSQFWITSINANELNRYYTVTYQTDGTWNNGYEPVIIRTVTEGVVLPTADNITLNDYEFMGWYDEDGNKVTEIPAGIIKDIVLTSKWKVTCTGDNLLNTIDRFNFGIYDITVTGNITSDTVSKIKDKCKIKIYNASANIKNNTNIKDDENFKMSLDLSQTTGLTSIDDNAFFYYPGYKNPNYNEYDYDGGAKSVTNYPEAGGGIATLTDIVLPESLTKIGQDAFYMCPNLKSITFSNSTENWEIKGYYHEGLYGEKYKQYVFTKNIDFSDPEQSANSLTNTRYISVYTCPYAGVIEATATDVVSKLSNLSSNTRYTVKLTGNITADTISSMKEKLKDDTKRIDLDLSQATGLTTLDKAAFAFCKSLTTLTLPGTLKNIKSHAFQECTNLSSLNIPDSVTHIGHAAFKNCYSLKNITIPDSVTSVGDDELCYYKPSVDYLECGKDSESEQAKLKLFENCMNLESVILPKNLTFYSSYYMFSECINLSSVTISGETPIVGNVTLPENIPEIGPCMFYGCESLTSVTIPGGVTRICYCAFDRCFKLESVTILDGVTYIEMDAFRYCTKLKDITIPNSVTRIGEFAFDGCTSLTNIIIPDGVTYIGRRVFDGCKNLESITFPASLTTLGREIFYECEKLESVYITDLDAWCNISHSGHAEDGGPFGATLSTGGVNLYLNGELVTHWDVPEDWTFVCTALRGIKSLESVTIPSGITFINEGAFAGCSNLTSVTFENTTNSWYAYDDMTNKTTKIDVTDAAQNATNLKSTYKSYQWYIDWGEVNATADKLVDVILSLPKGEHTVKVSGPITADTLKLLNSDNSSSELSYLLRSDKKKINLDLSGTTGLTEIPDKLFSHCEALKSIVIPDGVTSIGEYAFFRSYSLENVILPSSMKTIGSCAFKECTALKSITIPDSVTWFGNYVFYYCKDLESITIPDGVETIYEYTFYYCESLKSLTIPNSVTSIGDSAFGACHKLESLTIPDSVTTIGKYAFGNCGMLESLTIPDSVTTLEEMAFVGNYGLKSLTIGNGLTYIPDGTFIYDGDLGKYETLETLVTGDGLTSLDNLPITSALKSITIGKNVSSISGSQFSGCTNLTTFNVSEDNPNYSADGKILYNKDKTELISYPSATGEITIPDGVTSIGEGTFSGCTNVKTLVIGNGLTSLDNLPITEALESITIGTGITSIDDYTFYYCEKLRTVNYRGTQEQWEAITIGYGNSYLTYSTINYNYTE